MMTLVALALGLAYIGLIGCFFYGWENLTEPESQVTPSIFVSVIIAMRNEEHSIANLLFDLQLQDYPPHLFEIIVVDDHSIDHSADKAASFSNVKIFRLSGSAGGKKAALKRGIEIAKGELIVTTDADCRMGKGWLSSIAGCYESEHPALILAPVCGVGPSSFSQMLMLEQMSLLGSTAGSAAIGHPVMSNGANMAFAAEVLPYILPIYENERIRSGDDMFVLMELNRRFPGRVRYLKSKAATVCTQLPDSLGAFFRQRRRWAAKARFYSDSWVIGTAMVVLFVNGFLFIGLIYGFLFGVWLSFSILFLAKCLIDFLFLQRICSFFGENRLMKWFPVVQSFYFLYIVFTVCASLIPINRWKGRNIKQ